IANVQLAADLFEVDRLDLVGECGVSAEHESTGYARQVGGEALGHAVREIVLLRIATEVGERQHNNGKTRWRERTRGRALGPCQWTGIIPNHSIRPHGAINVLEGLLAQIDELDPSLALGVIV